MKPVENDASSFGESVASRLARMVPRASELGCAHSSLIGMPSVSKRWTSKSGILNTPSSCSYSPLVKNRTAAWPPEICKPALLRRPVPSGVVRSVDHRLKLVRLSATQTPVVAEVCDSSGVRQLRVDPAGACPQSVYAVGYVLKSLMTPSSPVTEKRVSPARPRFVLMTMTP